MKNQIRNQPRGFSVLELLLAMFIVSILAMVGLPTYQDYRVRTAVTRDFSLVNKAKLAVTEYYTINGKLPTNNQQVGLEEFGDFSDGKFNFKMILGSWGSIDATVILIYDTQEIRELDGWETLVFYADESNGLLRWDCTRGGSMPNRYRPANCRR